MYNECNIINMHIYSYYVYFICIYIGGFDYLFIGFSGNIIKLRKNFSFTIILT